MERKEILGPGVSRGPEVWQDTGACGEFCQCMRAGGRGVGEAGVVRSPSGLIMDCAERKESQVLQNVSKKTTLEPCSDLKHGHNQRDCYTCAG